MTSMRDLTRSSVIALSFAFGMAIVGTVLVEQVDRWIGDFFGLALVIIGVLIAALTTIETESE